MLAIPTIMTFGTGKHPWNQDSNLCPQTFWTNLFCKNPYVHTEYLLWWPFLTQIQITHWVLSASCSLNSSSIKLESIAAISWTNSMRQCPPSLQATPNKEHKALRGVTPRGSYFYKLGILEKWNSTPWNYCLRTSSTVKKCMFYS